MLKDICIHDNDFGLHHDHLHDNCAHDHLHHQRPHIDFDRFHLNHDCNPIEHPVYDIHINTDCSHDHSNNTSSNCNGNCSTEDSSCMLKEILKLKDDVKHLSYYIQHMNTNPFLFFNNNLFDPSALLSYVDDKYNNLSSILSGLTGDQQDLISSLTDGIKNVSTKLLDLSNSVTSVIGTGVDDNDAIDTLKDILNFLRNMSDNATLEDLLAKQKDTFESELLEDERVIAKALGELKKMIDEIVDAIDILEL